MRSPCSANAAADGDCHASAHCADAALQHVHRGTLVDGHCDCVRYCQRAGDIHQHRYAPAADPDSGRPSYGHRDGRWAEPHRDTSAAEAVAYAPESIGDTH